MKTLLTFLILLCMLISCSKNCDPLEVTVISKEHTSGFHWTIKGGNIQGYTYPQWDITVENCYGVKTISDFGFIAHTDNSTCFYDSVRIGDIVRLKYDIRKYANKRVAKRKE